MEQVLTPFGIDINRFIPIFMFVSWAIVGFMIWTGITFIRDLMLISRRMHRIPCANCRYFTGNYQLKCTVRPHVALTEDAIHCTDFQK